MIYRKILLGIVGFSSGLLVSGGIFMALIVVGLIPRFAEKTHTAEKVFQYENVVVAGTIMGTLTGTYDTYTGAFFEWVNSIVGREAWQYGGRIFLIFYGIFAGCFVGCMALAIAEMLDSIPIFSRRIKFRKGLGFAVLSIALGKLAGSLIYFIEGVYRYGG